MTEENRLKENKSNKNQRRERYKLLQTIDQDLWTEEERILVQKVNQEKRQNADYTNAIRIKKKERYEELRLKPTLDEDEIAELHKLQSQKDRKSAYAKNRYETDDTVRQRNNEGRRKRREDAEYRKQEKLHERRHELQLEEKYKQIKTSQSDSMTEYELSIVTEYESFLSERRKNISEKQKRRKKKYYELINSVQRDEMTPEQLSFVTKFEARMDKKKVGQKHRRRNKVNRINELAIKVENNTITEQEQIELCKLENDKLIGTLSKLLKDALSRDGGTKMGKSNYALELLGCDIYFFKKYIADQFIENMSWSNHGLWHLDHIRPCVSFNQLDEQQRKICWHYSNFQPLWAIDNITKNAQLDWVKPPKYFA